MTNPKEDLINPQPTRKNLTQFLVWGLSAAVIFSTIDLLIYERFNLTLVVMTFVSSGFFSFVFKSSLKKLSKK